MPNKRWRSLEDDFPDWKDTGHVELRMSDGATAIGQLSIEDVGWNGEDEYPIFRLVLDNGTDADLHSFDQWRLI